METLLAKWGDRMRPGDVFVMNDPFDGGIHLQDIFVFKPVFLDDALIGFATTTAHHGDVGGRLPGSAACDNTEIFQEGIRLPWLRLYDRGEPVEAIFEVIRANVRIPRMTLGDLAAQVAATSVAERALQELAAPLRRRAARRADDRPDRAHRAARAAARSPAGPTARATFTDYLDSDGIERRDVPITATVTIAGDEITADLTESSPMVAGRARTRRARSSRRASTRRCARRSRRDPEHVGRVPADPRADEAGDDRARRHAGRVVDARRHRLPRARRGQRRARAADPGSRAGRGRGRQHARGLRRRARRTARAFIFYELVVGTWGGTPEGDGNDGVTNPASLAANIPVEVAESEFPIVIERYGLVPDSGGAGKHRGGLAVERVWRCLTPDTSLIVRSDRSAHPPYGLAGGAPGALSSNLLIHAGRDRGGAAVDVLDDDRPGDVYVHRTAGGGGWGDPAERDPAEASRPTSPTARSRS